MSDPQETMALGVVLERRPIYHNWADWSWRAVTVIPGAAPLARPRELRRDGEAVLFHAATLPLGLHRKETEGYRVNLSQSPPKVFIGLRPGDGEEAPPQPFVVTACPFEAEDYEVDSEDRVEAVAMPPEVAAMVGHFIDEHHVEQPFVKRKRKPYDPRKGGPRHG